MRRTLGDATGPSYYRAVPLLEKLLQQLKQARQDRPCPEFPEDYEFWKRDLGPVLEPLPGTALRERCGEDWLDRLEKSGELIRNRA